MADFRGYEVIRQAIPKHLAQEAASSLTGQPKNEREKYNAYMPTPACIAVINEFFEKTDKSALATFFHPKPIPPPDHVFAAIFRNTQANPNNKKTGHPQEIYVTIALTPLSSDNGWYTFYAGTRAGQRPPDDETLKVALTLDVGDVVVWRGDIIYFHSSGGGGKFQNIAYKQG